MKCAVGPVNGLQQTNSFLQEALTLCGLRGHRLTQSESDR